MNCRSYHGENYYQKKRIFFSFFIRLEKKTPINTTKKTTMWSRYFYNMKLQRSIWFCYVALLLAVDLCIAIGVYSVQNGIKGVHITFFALFYIVLVLWGLGVFMMAKDVVVSNSNDIITINRDVTVESSFKQEQPLRVKRRFRDNWPIMLKILTNAVSLFTGGLFGFCFGLWLDIDAYY